jgi:hypothetical protein
MSTKSNKFFFMRDKDINIVNDNVDNIIERARNREIQVIEPKLEEFNKVKSVIMDFIKKEKRIIYGGYAWNALIKKVNPSDSFYKSSDYTDVEFYSNKPIEDLKNLCDLLHDKKFKFVQGKSAQHEETYTIFVNFTAYCDISYMPSNIFYNIMTEPIDGYRLIHPKFIMIDILRQFNDPLTSFWRLDKNIKRGKLMIKNYPLELITVQHVAAKLNSKSLELIDYLFDFLTKSSSILFIGQIALGTYTHPNKDVSKQHIDYDQTPIELISTNLSNDIKNIYNLLIKYFLDQHKTNEFSDKIIFEQYYPFFQFTDKKAIFKYNGETFLIIYGNNEKCIPFNNIQLKYKSSSYPIKIGTFNFIFMINLIGFHQAYSDKNKSLQSLRDYNLYLLLKSRDDFLNQTNKTVLDQTIFEDFKINCLGDPISPMRKFMLSRNDRKLMPRSAIPPYNPEEKRDNFPFDSYFFYNCSGNIINNPKDFIFNPKKKS